MTKISALPLDSSLSLSDVIAILNSTTSTTSKATLQSLSTLIGRNDLLYNPVKFNVYLSSGSTQVGSGTIARVQFDTRNFDTGSNVDVSSTKGRFTAPVSGFYFLASTVSAAAYGSAINYITFYKNGGPELQRGSQQQVVTSNSTIALSESGLFQLAANDYIDVFWYNGGGGAMGLNGGGASFFSGFMVSAT